jgi:hypothetical protein
MNLSKLFTSPPVPAAGGYSVPFPPIELLAEATETGAPEPEPEAYEFLWEGRKVLLLLPVYRSFNADTHYTLFANYAKYGPEKIGILMEKRTLIHEARNILVDRARQVSGVETVIFCDDDMILPCGSAAIFNGKYKAKVPEPSASLNAITRIMSHTPNARIVGGLYFGRYGNGRAQCHMGFSEQDGGNRLRNFKMTKLIEQPWVGTGWMRIQTNVFDDMEKHIAAGNWPECKSDNPKVPLGFFAPLKVGVGEDVSFCRRAAEIGIKTYLDPALICLHAGDTLFGPNNTTG